MALRIRISRVSDLCAQTGKTQAALADFLEVTEGYVSQVASQKSKTKFSVIQMSSSYRQLQLEIERYINYYNNHRYQWGLKKMPLFSTGIIYCQLPNNLLF